MKSSASVISSPLFLMLLPGLAYFLVFAYAPMTGLIIAFKDFSLQNGIFHSPWNGLANFRTLFEGTDFLLTLRNTVTISILRLTFGFAAPIILALLLNELRVVWLGKTVQTLTYLPHFLSWVILGGVFLMIFAGDGPFNKLVALAGAKPIPFYSDNFWFLVLVVATGIWQSAGFGAIIYLAALSGISPQLYEAAQIDGAGRWQQIWRITLPCLTPTIVTLFILNLGQILNAGFDQIYNMYNPVVYGVSDIIDTFVLRHMVTMDFDIATAAGLFKAVVGMLLILAANTLVKTYTKGEHGVW